MQHSSRTTRRIIKHDLWSRGYHSDLLSNLPLSLKESVIVEKWTMAQSCFAAVQSDVQLAGFISNVLVWSVYQRFTSSSSAATAQIVLVKLLAKSCSRTKLSSVPLPLLIFQLQALSRMTTITLRRLAWSTKMNLTQTTTKTGRRKTRAYIPE